MGRRTFFGVVAFVSVVGGETEMESVEFGVQRGGLKEGKGLRLIVEVATVNGESVGGGLGGSSSNDMDSVATAQFG